MNIIQAIIISYTIILTNSLNICNIINYLKIQESKSNALHHVNMASL